MNPEVMDLGLIRGIITAVLLAAFIGMVFWAYSKRRHSTFSEASMLPLEENDGIRDKKFEMPCTDWEIEGNKR